MEPNSLIIAELKNQFMVEIEQNYIIVIRTVVGNVVQMKIQIEWFEGRLLKVHLLKIYQKKMFNR